MNQKKLVGALSIAAFALISCSEENTYVTQQLGMKTFEDVKSFDDYACQKENAGEMVYVTDGASAYLCSEGKWVTLNGKDGKDGKTIRVQLKLSAKTVLMSRMVKVALPRASRMVSKLFAGKIPLAS